MEKSNNKQIILDTIETISTYMFNYLSSNNSNEYLMIYKNISHSDLTNSGKRNGSNEDLEKNILYYLSNEEMNNMQNSDGRVFESAKQSNIYLPEDFYDFLGVPLLQRRIGYQELQHQHIKINEYARVYLVNDTLKYFQGEYTRKIIEKLNKKQKWKEEELYYELSKNDLTEIELHYAILGIGTKEDSIFHKLRKSIFKNDILCILVEKNSSQKSVYIMLKKNPLFYSIINDYNYKWSDHLLKKLKEDESKLKLYLDANEEYESMPQSTWKKALAEEMMNYTTNENEVFCPLTYISSNYENSSTLYRASHIKPKRVCTLEEMIDVNNGLLLSANADALFDKYLISIGENCEILFSFLIFTDQKLLASIKLLDNKLFKPLLNENRKKYIEHHRHVFFEKEKERKEKRI
jgi:hypothetical protein